MFQFYTTGLSEINILFIRGKLQSYYKSLMSRKGWLSKLKCIFLIKTEENTKFYKKSIIELMRYARKKDSKEKLSAIRYSRGYYHSLSRIEAIEVLARETTHVLKFDISVHLLQSSFKTARRCRKSFRILALWYASFLKHEIKVMLGVILLAMFQKVLIF